MQANVSLQNSGNGGNDCPKRLSWRSWRSLRLLLFHPSFAIQKANISHGKFIQKKFEVQVFQRLCPGSEDPYGVGRPLCRTPM